MVNGTLPQDRRALILRWIEEQEALCVLASAGPWRQMGLAIDGADGNVALLNLARGAKDTDANGGLIMSARSVLPLALAALRAEIDAHHVDEDGDCAACPVNYYEEPTPIESCPTIDRLFCSLGLQDSGR